MRIIIHPLILCVCLALAVSLTHTEREMYITELLAIEFPLWLVRVPVLSHLAESLTHQHPLVVSPHSARLSCVTAKLPTI